MQAADGMCHRAALPQVFAMVFDKTMPARLLVEYPLALAGIYGSSPDSGLIVPVCRRKEGRGACGQFGGPGDVFTNR